MMTERLFNYFDLAHAIATHAAVIEKSGGLRGIKDEGQIDSILHHIQNEDYYPDFIDKVTHLVFSFIKFHCFNDGNKRASLVLSSFFLEINEHDYCLLKYQHEMENIVVWVAENKISKELLRDLIESILYEDDYSEELKLRLIAATIPEDYADE